MKNADVNSIFAPKPQPAKSGRKAKVHEKIDFPKELRLAADVVAAGRQIQDEIKDKIAIAETMCKQHMTRVWCEKFLATGRRPDMARFHGDEGSFDFVQTRRMTITAEKTEALEAMGIDISGYLETTGVTLDLAAVERYGLMEKLQQALAKLVANEAQLADIVKPKVETKEELLDALPGLCRGDDGNDVDRLMTAMEILKPVPQIKKPEIDKNPQECFSLVFSANLK